MLAVRKARREMLTPEICVPLGPGRTLARVSGILLRNLRITPIEHGVFDQKARTGIPAAGNAFG